MSAKALQSSPIAKARHDFSLDRFTGSGARNVKVQMYFFGLLVLKAKLPDCRHIYVPENNRNIASGLKSPGYEPSYSFPCFEFVNEVLKLN